MKADLTEGEIDAIFGTRGDEAESGFGRDLGELRVENFEREPGDESLILKIASGNGAAKPDKTPLFSVGEPDRFNRRTVSFSFGDKLVARDKFDPDSNAACDGFAQRIFEKSPGQFVEEMARRHLGLPDDRFPSKPLKAFKEWVCASIFNHAETQQAETALDARTFNRISAADLANAVYNVQFHIPGVLVAGQPQCIFGAKKSLKTTIALDQAISIATGGMFLGYFHVARSARVAVFSGESGMPTIQETCLRICRAAGVRLEDTGIVFSDTLPQFGDVRSMDAFEKFLTADQIEVVYVDPCYLAMLTEGNEASIFHMGAMLRSISETCQRIGVTPILLHHMKKSVIDPYSPGDLDDASWAGFAEFARGWQLINRREKYLPGSGVHKLWLSIGGSVGHGGLWAVDIREGVYDGPGSRSWDVTVMKAEDVRAEAAEAQAKVKRSKQEDKIEAASKALIGAMAKYPAGETSKAIRETAGMSGTVAKLAMAKLLQDGVAVPCEVIKPNRKLPYEGYKLADDAS